jgi:hypothetical protein
MTSSGHRTSTSSVASWPTFLTELAGGWVAGTYPWMNLTFRLGRCT